MGAYRELTPTTRIHFPFSRIGTCTSRKGLSSALIAEEDSKNYIVTETGITIVTRDYSLFESPVPVDYFTSE